MANESRTTTDHETIRKWVEARGGKPSAVKSTERNGDVGLLRINFPGYGGEDSLEEISWDDFFAKFDEKHLAFLYQDQTSSGEQSRFFKFVNRDTVEHGSHTRNAKADDKTHSTHSEHSSSTAHTAKTEEKAGKAEPKHEEKAHKTEHKASGHTHDDKTHTAHGGHDADKTSAKSTTQDKSHKEHVTKK